MIVDGNQLTERLDAYSANDSIDDIWESWKTWDESAKSALKAMFSGASSSGLKAIFEQNPSREFSGSLRTTIMAADLKGFNGLSETEKRELHTELVDETKEKIRKLKSILSRLDDYIHESDITNTADNREP
ncbi:hypothetical protein HZZ02_19725, partial [Streptococcus danieliae]|nr:hypothetical protein [Streptococcus danieliae]